MSGNHFCIFPAGKKASAEAYKAACDAHYAATYEPGGTAVWLREDSTGDWVVQFYGSPFDPDGTGTFVEPDGFAELRVDAVIEPSWTPRPEE